jgi:hypothetical protein
VYSGWRSRTRRQEARSSAEAWRQSLGLSTGIAENGFKLQ